MVSSNDTSIGTHLRLVVRDGLGTLVDPCSVTEPSVGLDAELEPYASLVATHFVAPAAALAEVATALGESEELLVDGLFVAAEGSDGEAVRVLRAAGAYDSHIFDVLSASGALRDLGFGDEAIQIAVRCGLVAAIPDDVAQAGTAVMYRAAIDALLSARHERRTAALREQLSELDVDVDPVDGLLSAHTAEQEAIAARTALFGSAEETEQQQLADHAAELHSLRDEAAALLAEVRARHVLAREQHVGPRAAERDALTRRRDREAAAVARLERPSKLASFGARRRQRAAEDHAERLAAVAEDLAQVDHEIDSAAGATLRASNTAQRRLDALDAECSASDSRLAELHARRQAADAAEADVRACWADRIAAEAEELRAARDTRRAGLLGELELVDRHVTEASRALHALLDEDATPI